MKHLILLIFFYPLILFGQVHYSDTLYKANLPINNENNLIEFDEIIIVEGVTKEELFSRAREWFALRFNSANHVIQMEDEKNGKLIGKGFSNIIVTFMNKDTKEMLHYTISVYLKEEKYRVKMSNFFFQVYPSQRVDILSKMTAESLIIDMLYNKRGKPYKTNKTRKEQLLIESSEIIADLNFIMKNGINSDDDW